MGEIGISLPLEQGYRVKPGDKLTTVLGRPQEGTIWSGLGDRVAVCQVRRRLGYDRQTWVDSRVWGSRDWCGTGGGQRVCPGRRGTRWSCSNAGSQETTLKKSLSAMAAKETLRMDKSYKRCGHKWNGYLGGKNAHFEVPHLCTCYLLGCV